MKHFSKLSRYRICFQTKNKVWIYKNSRLRNFYKLRGKIILKTGFRAKRFLITRNMKWTVARRQMVPYFRTKNRFSFFYKNLFFTKQQLKAFYGGLKEYQLRNLFKKTWHSEQNFRRNVFLSALEQRLSVVLYRMRVLPTIFACNQLIKHHGVFVNNHTVTLINYRVKLGDIVSVPQAQWFMFYKFLYERLNNRFFANGLLLWRKEFILKKLQYFRIRKKIVYISNLRLLKKFNIEKNRFIIFQKLLFKFYKISLKNPVKNLQDIQFIKILNIMLYHKIYPIILKINGSLFQLRRWNFKEYFPTVNFILYNIFNLQYLLREFKFLMYSHITEKFWKIFDLIQKDENLDLSTFPVNDCKTKTDVSEKIVDLMHSKYFWLIRSQELYKLKFKHFLGYSYKRSLILKMQFRYKKYFKFLLRKLKYRKNKKKLFKNWCRTPHWYIPKYLEVDYNTLRAAFIYYPDFNEVHYGFLCSFKKIISFYKERAL